MQRGHFHCHHVTIDEIIFCSFYLHNNGSSVFFLRRRYATNIFIALHVGDLKSDSSNVYILLIYICNLTFAKQVFAYSLFRLKDFLFLKSHHIITGRNLSPVNQSRQREIIILFEHNCYLTWGLTHRLILLVFWPFK